MRSLPTPRPFRCALAAIAVFGVLACDASASASASDLTAPLRAPEVAPRNLPADIVRVAQAELEKGIRETPMGSDNSAGITRYRNAMVPHAHGGPWCAYFASWVTRRAGAPLGSHGDGIASAAGIRAWAGRTGRWRQLPRAGDVAVYTGHVGIVASVRGSRMTTIEGNWSTRVTGLSRRRNEALGFARVAVGDHTIR